MPAEALHDCAQVFSATLLELAEDDERICIVINDSAETHHATAFAERHPERIVDVGIAEQNMVGVAAGLANGGRRAFVHSASCFLSARAMEQVKDDVAYERADVTLCGFVSGMAYGALGGTHHSNEDLAWMRAIPNLRVAAPGSPRDTAAVVRTLVAEGGPAFVRILSKTKVPELFGADHAFQFGRAAWLAHGTDVTLVGTGLTTSRLLRASELLERDGVSAGVLHMGSISPIDEDAIVAAVEESGRLAVAEEHVTSGGLGGAVAEVVVRTRPAPVLSLGVPDVFAPIGPPAWLHEQFGLTAEALAERVGAWLDGGTR
jgi:transketolase